MWALKINKITYGVEGKFACIDLFYFQASGTAIFDSTTRFIWTENSII